MTDTELLCQVQQGDQAAMRALYERYLPSIWRYVYGRTGGDEQLAQDIVGETFLAAAQSLGELDANQGTVCGWLIGIARHKLGDDRRRLRRTEGLARVARTEKIWNDPAAPLEVGETRVLVLQVMERLPPEERLALEWKYLEDLSVRQISERLGRTEKAIEALLYRARNDFRALAQELENTGAEK